MGSTHVSHECNDHFLLTVLKAQSSQKLHPSSVDKAEIDRVLNSPPTGREGLFRTMQSKLFLREVALRKHRENDAGIFLDPSPRSP